MKTSLVQVGECQVIVRPHQAVVSKEAYYITAALISAAEGGNDESTGDGEQE